MFLVCDYVPCCNLCVCCTFSLTGCCHLQTQARLFKIWPQTPMFPNSLLLKTRVNTVHLLLLTHPPVWVLHGCRRNPPLPSPLLRPQPPGLHHLTLRPDPQLHVTLLPLWPHLSTPGWLKLLDPRQPLPRHSSPSSSSSRKITRQRWRRKRLQPSMWT